MEFKLDTWSSFILRSTQRGDPDIEDLECLEIQVLSSGLYMKILKIETYCLVELSLSVGESF